MVYRSKILLATVFFLGAYIFYCCPASFAADTGAIKPGDKVGIQFTCRFSNGDIAASTSASVAADSSLRKSPVYLPRSKDEPVEVTAGRSAVVKSFPVPFLDEIVARIAATLPGTRPGEARTIEIRSERAAGVPEKEQFLELSRTRQRPKEIRMTGDEYKSRTGKAPEVGDEWMLDSLVPGKVASVSEKEVVIRASVQPGTVVDTPFGKGTVRENGNQYEIVFEAARGTLVRMGPFVGRISDAQDRMFTIDFGHPFGGEPLTCEVKTESIPANKLSEKE